MFNNSESKISLVGLGKMGSGIADRLIDCGYDIMVFDAFKPTMARFRGKCKTAELLSEAVSYGDVICTSLPGTTEVDAVVDSFIENGADGRCFIDFSTSYPLSNIYNEQRIVSSGGKYLESPLTGVPSNAPEGKLGLIVAGEEDVYEELLPFLRNVGSKISYAGKAGSGDAVKIACNYLAISYIALYAEILPLLDKYGVNYDAFYSAVSGSATDCGMFQRIAPKIHNDNYTISFLMKHAIKDIGYAKKLFAENNYPSPMLDACVSVFNMAKCMGLNEQDVSEVARVTKFFFGGK